MFVEARRRLPEMSRILEFRSTAMPTLRSWFLCPRTRELSRLSVRHHHSTGACFLASNSAQHVLPRVLPARRRRRSRVMIGSSIDATSTPTRTSRCRFAGASDHSSLRSPFSVHRSPNSGVGGRRLKNRGGAGCSGPTLRSRRREASRPDSVTCRHADPPRGRRGSDCLDCAR